MRVYAVVPAFNEAKTVAEVVRSLTGACDRVLVVDDGSSDRTAEAAREAGAEVLRHSLNRGLGAALGTGIAAAVADGADIVFTFDADGQHRAGDIPRLIEPIAAGRADVAIGVRTADRRKMPLRRRLANWAGNALTYALFGLWVQDSQSGLRAFSLAAARDLRLRCDRMDVSSEIIKEIKAHGWRLAEVPIQPIYTVYSLSKGQSFFVGLKTAGRLLLRRLIG